MNSKIKKRCITLILFSMILFACSADGQKSTADRHSGGKVRIGLIGTIQELYPYSLKEYYAQEISRYLLNPALVRQKENGQPIPVLAAAWKNDTKNNSLTFYIRKKILWSNGEALTSADIISSYDFLKKNEAQLTAGFNLSGISEVTAIDSFTIRFQFASEKIDPFRASHFPILNHQQVDSALSFEESQAAFQQSFIGCGPFILQDINSDQIILKRNPYYSENKPLLDAIIFNFYRAADSIMIALNKEEIDLAPALPINLEKQISALKNFNKHTVLENGFDFIGWNLDRPRLSSPNVRRALTHAIDRVTLVDGILSGYGKIHDSPAFPDFWAYLQIDPLVYDPQQASRLFAQEGWIVNPETKLLQNNGTAFELNLITNAESSMRADIAVNIKAYYRVLGIEVRTEVLPWDQLLKRLEQRNFDGVIISWQENGPFDLAELFHSSSIATGNNFMGYSSSIVDSCLEKAMQLNPLEERLDSWRAFQKLVVADQPITVLFTKNDFTVYSKKLGNVHITGHGFLKNADNWYIREGRPEKDN